jgi:hypothetical protein
MEMARVEMFLGFFERDAIRSISHLLHIYDATFWPRKFLETSIEGTPIVMGLPVFPIWAGDETPVSLGVFEICFLFEYVCLLSKKFGTIHNDE